MRLILPLLILLFTTVIVPSQTTQEPRVGNIQNSKIADGCGCYFQFPGMKRHPEKNMFFAADEGENQKEAWMNIEGKDVKLTLVSRTDPKSRERVGSRSTRKYAAQEIILDVTYVATRVCGVNEENCESTDYDATFKLSVQGRQRIIKAKGGCGC